MMCERDAPSSRAPTVNVSVSLGHYATLEHLQGIHWDSGQMSMYVQEVIQLTGLRPAVH